MPRGLKAQYLGTGASVRRFFTSEAQVAASAPPPSSRLRPRFGLGPAAVLLAPAATGLCYYAGLYHLRVGGCEATLQRVADASASESRAPPGAKSSVELPPGRRQDIREFRRALSAPPSRVIVVASHSAGSAKHFVSAAMGGRAAAARVCLPAAAAAGGSASLTDASAARALASSLGMHFLTLRHQVCDLFPAFASADSSGAASRRELLLCLETATAALQSIRAQDPEHHLPPVIVIDGLLPQDSGCSGCSGVEGSAADVLLAWCREVTGEQQLAHIVLTAPEDWVVRSAAAAAAAESVQIWALKPPARDDAEAFVRARLQATAGLASARRSGAEAAGSADSAEAAAAAAAAAAAELLVDVLHGPAADVSGLLNEAARLLARERRRSADTERAEVALHDMVLAAWSRAVSAIRLAGASEEVGVGGAASPLEAAGCAACGVHSGGQASEARLGRLPELFSLLHLLGRDAAVPMATALALLGGDGGATVALAALCELGVLRLSPRGLSSANGKAEAAARAGAERQEPPLAAADGAAASGSSDGLLLPTLAEESAEEFGAEEGVGDDAEVEPPAAAIAAASVASFGAQAATPAQNSASSSASAAAAMSEDAAFAFQVSAASPLVAGAFLVLEHWPTPAGPLGDLVRKAAGQRAAARQLQRQAALVLEQEACVSRLRSELLGHIKAYSARRSDRQPVGNQSMKASLAAAEERLQAEELELAKRRAAAQVAAASAAGFGNFNDRDKEKELAAPLSALAVSAAQQVTDGMAQATAASSAARWSTNATLQAAAAVMTGVAEERSGVLTAGDVQVVLSAFGRFFSAVEIREGVKTLSDSQPEGGANVDAAALAAHFVRRHSEHNLKAAQRRLTQQRLRRSATRRDGGAAAAAAATAAAADSAASGVEAAAGAESGSYDLEEDDADDGGHSEYGEEAAAAAAHGEAEAAETAAAALAEDGRDDLRGETELEQGNEPGESPGA